MSTPSPDLPDLRLAADRAVARPGSPWHAAIVLDECASTQDAALHAGAGTPGLVLVAGRQRAGRGRLGRAWHDESGLGLALTCVLPAHTPSLPLVAGVAILRAVRSLGARLIGLKWPNDVVERDGRRRKLAGVLVEVKNGVTLLGVGLNVLQTQRDWPAPVQGRAVSLRELGVTTTRADVLAAVLASLDAVLSECRSDAGLRATLTEWRAADVLTGTEQEFDHDGTRVRGIIRAIDPLTEILLATPQGDVRLPASCTSLVKQ
ncbi:MAG: biotin--[acetyl-CoA-carboxylase] ligase [Leptolyngbya sp. PLA1]|nr:biotin--[acetyl-CoA-carboxylase] ligase [Leptolyngbya sp. PLA1]